MKICIICGKEHNGRGLTCSRSCCTKMQIQKRGSPFARKDVQEKSKKTMIERYGVPYAQMNNEIKDKTRESEGAQRTKFKKGQDYREFWINKLGVDNPQKDSEVLRKRLETNQKRYGGNSPMNSKEVSSKVHQTMSLNNKDNKFEQEIKEYIKSLDSSIKIVSNTKEILINPNTNCKLELDIYLPEYNIAIECMGNYSHNYDVFPEKEERDKLKISLCKDQGIKLIQLWEDDWYNKSSNIKEVIRKCLK